MYNGLIIEVSLHKKKKKGWGSFNKNLSPHHYINNLGNLKKSRLKYLNLLYTLDQRRHLGHCVWTVLLLRKLDLVHTGFPRSMGLITEFNNWRTRQESWGKPIRITTIYSHSVILVRFETRIPSGNFQD